MRCVTLLTLVLLIAYPFTLHAEDADEVREKGITALKDSQTNPRAIVEAARLFVRAGALYGDAGNEEKNVEMNSFLYWCKKKMTLADIEQFTKGGEEAVASKLAAVEKAAPKADDAQKWFDRADQFAKKNPDEHLLIAIRFYEVADRFKGSDPGVVALDRSLKEMLQEKSSAVKTVVPPTTIKPTETVANDIAKRPIPGADDLKTAEKLIKDLLKADYAKTDAPSRLALIAKLLQQADENKNDAALVYVCLHESRDLAILIGDVTKAAEVQIRLSDSFKSDFAAILLDLKKLESSAKTAEPATALAALFTFEAERASAEADYDQAVRFNSRAEDLLPLSKDAALKARLKTEIPRVQAIKRDSVAALAAQKTLATKPDDAEANLTAGKFALLLGEVEKSMALLAKSKDGVLSALAKRELAPSQESAEQTLLADGWFDRAEKEGSTYLKGRMQDRAALWYATALPGLAGVAKLKVEGRMKLLPQGAKTENSVANSSKTEPASPAKKEPTQRWISKDATYTVSSIYLHFKPMPSLLNGENPAYSTDPGDGFSFHTNNEVNPHVVIDLGVAYQISRFEIASRGTTTPTDQKTKTLTMWVSNQDAGPWTEVWRAENAALKWQIDLPRIIEARYVKVGLRVKEVLYLASIKIFGDESKGGNSSKKETAVSVGNLKELVLDLGGGIKMELIPIPAGTFAMGSPPGKGRGDERQHPVTISKPYYIGKYLVTQEQYEAITGTNPSRTVGPKNPVDQVIWKEAEEFCDKMTEKTKAKLPPGYRVLLPTEAQWEYACRAGTKTQWSCGDSMDDLLAAAWIDRNGEGKTHPVGEKKPNAWGLYDMHGNVWQWCADWKEDYSGKAQTDPQGPAKGSMRVLRGGSFTNSPDDARTAFRANDIPDGRNAHQGFRVVVAISLPKAP